VNQQKNQEQMSWELSRQREQLDEQEAERIAEEQRVAEEMRQREYRKLKARYDAAVNNLRRAKIQLDDVASFHLLRTLDEKDAEVSAQLEVVRSWENEVDRLKYKLDNFN
jgi:non-ribosomal peptide synthetase component E (peptide arylation enzyme)